MNNMKDYGKALTEITARLIYFDMITVGAVRADKELDESVHTLDRAISTLHLFKEIFEKFNFNFTISNDTLIMNINHEDFYEIELTSTKIELLKEWFSNVKYG